MSYVLIDFFAENYFLIAKLILITGVALCVFAMSSKKGNGKITNNKLAGKTSTMEDDNILNDKEKINKVGRGIIFGLGGIAIIVGILLIVLMTLAVIMVIYIFSVWVKQLT